MNKKEIFISVFQMAEKGELNRVEQIEIMTALISLGWSLKSEEVDETFKNIRLGSRHLFEQTEKCIDSALVTVLEYHKMVKDVLKQGGDLPNGASLGDDMETLKFINSLSKDVYNFSEAEKLIGVSRQTIKKHAEKELYSLKVTRIAKTDYITRENLIKYYRVYFNKDGYSF